MTRSSARKPRTAFTAKEWEVIERKRHGLSAKAIGGELGLSERAVEDRLYRARKRAGAWTTFDLLVRAGARPRVVRK